MGGVLISGLCCSVLGLFQCECRGGRQRFRAEYFYGFTKKSVCFAGKLPFVPGSGASGNMAEYQLLSAAGIRNYPGICYGIRNTEKKKKISWMLEKKCPRTRTKSEECSGSCKRAYPAGIFLLAAAGGIFVLSRKPERSSELPVWISDRVTGIVLEIPEGGVFLMDCGKQRQQEKNTAQYQLLPYLKSRGISHINGIMISHTDKDHIKVGSWSFLNLWSRA